MATIKTKQQIYDEIVLDLENKLGITLSTFGRVLLRILALVYAGALKLVYLSIGFVQKNVAPDLADPEEKGSGGSQVSVSLLETLYVILGLALFLTLCGLGGIVFMMVLGVLFG
jgi:hypothetical protein